MEVPDFRERYELPDGMFRTRTVPAFEEVVVRELLVNALVHRPYTQRGDIFLNLHPDRLEVVNPGRLPLGVTPAERAARHRASKRAAGARVPRPQADGARGQWLRQDLRSACSPRPPGAELTETHDSRAGHRARAASSSPTSSTSSPRPTRRYQLTQRERITLGLLAQTEGLTAVELVARLGLTATGQLRPWLGNLVELGLVEQTGRTKATRYFVPPEILRASGLDARTTLRRVQPHRLRALILEDLERYPGSSSTEVHGRVGPEIPLRTFSRALKELADEGRVSARGEARWTRYSLAPSIGQEGNDGR